MVLCAVLGASTCWHRAGHAQALKRTVEALQFLLFEDQECLDIVEREDDEEDGGVKEWWMRRGFK